MKNLFLLLLLGSYSLFSQEKSKVVSSNITMDTHWNHDTTYVLDGRIFVADSAVLTIDSGTVIKGSAGEGSSASMLIIARNSQIIAEGTRAFPIIFTSIADDIYFDAAVMRHVGTNNLGSDAKGIWGGLVILGNAQGSFPQAQSEFVLDGFSPTEDLAYFGGDNNEESSGVLRYVSIRHGGVHIGEGNEIGSLTLGAVGELTEIDHVEVYAGLDDGLDIYGGNVNIKHAILDEIDDDAVDYDQGYLGSMQFVFVKQSADAAVEADGGEGEEVQGQPIFYNFTVLDSADISSEAFDIRFSGLIIENSVFQDFSRGIRMDDETYAYLDGSNTAAEFSLGNSIFDNVAEETPESILDVRSGNYNPQVINFHFNRNGNSIQELPISRSNPVPPLDAADEGEPAVEPWFEQVNYQGAFEPGSQGWHCGWTRSYPQCSTVGVIEKTAVLDVSIFPNPTTQVVRLTANYTGTVEVYGIHGQLVKQFVLSNNNSLDVSDLAAGSYVLVGYSAQGNFSQTLIIE